MHEPGQARFTWGQMRAYWDAQSRVWSDLDLEKDPDALSNVLISGAPDWLNAYYARFQRTAFKRLLACIPPPSPGARALDVGCGAARWSRILAARGYTTTGIDLQSSLIEANRRRFPHINFQCSPMQEFEDVRGFDLISTVTVLQHLPHDEQNRALEHLRKLVHDRGVFIALENIADQGPHVFANSIREWSALFQKHGFGRRVIVRYDYSPCIRLVASSRSLLRSRAGPAHTLSPDALAEGWRQARKGRSPIRRLFTGLLRAAVVADSQLEGTLIAANPPLPTVHCGFVFEAT